MTDTNETITLSAAKVRALCDAAHAARIWLDSINDMHPALAQESIIIDLGISSAAVEAEMNAQVKVGDAPAVADNATVDWIKAASEEIANYDCEYRNTPADRIEAMIAKHVPTADDSKELLDWLDARGRPETFEDAPHSTVWVLVGDVGVTDLREAVRNARAGNP